MLRTRVAVQFLFDRWSVTDQVKSRPGRNKPDRATRHLVSSMHASIDEPVRSGDTPVGKGLVTCRQVESRSRLLEVQLSEVLAVLGSAAHEHAAPSTLKAAKAAYSSMPQQLLHFVQGINRTCVEAAPVCRNVTNSAVCRLPACSAAIGSSSLVVAQAWHTILARIYSKLAQGAHLKHCKRHVLMLQTAKVKVHASMMVWLKSG